MSQQHEMEFADLHMDELETPQQGYRGPSYRDYAAEHRQQEKAQFASTPDLHDADAPRPNYCVADPLGHRLLWNSLGHYASSAHIGIYPIPHAFLRYADLYCTCTY
jgi:hypothetical protein